MLPRVIFVLGCPASGKGTLCQSLIKKYPSMVHISAGDLLRRERDTGTSETAKVIQSCILEGKIVPSEITASLLYEEMVAVENYAKYIFLLDGYPRNEENWEAWQQYLEKTEYLGCLSFNCSYETMKARILKRVKETVSAGKTARSDDTEEVMRKRFSGHEKDTLPVIELMKKSSACWTIDAEGDAVDVLKSVETVLRNINLMD